MLAQLPSAERSFIFDLHNNGATLPATPQCPAKIVAFNDPSLSFNDLRAVLEHLRELGTTLVLPTIMTTVPQVVLRNAELIALAMDEPWGELIGGIHLEGPFINRAARGAHPIDHVQETPDIGFIHSVFEAAKGRIALLTLSPNLNGVVRFIEKIRELGVEVSLGHHTANPAQIEEAISAGARGITHLGNAGLKPLRSKGEDLLAQAVFGDDTYVMLIPDGVHVTSDFIKYTSRIVEALRPGHTVWVSDSSPLATAPIGTAWHYDGQVSTVVRGADGVVRPEPLSGSYLLLPECLERLRRMQIVDEELLLAGASCNPLEFMTDALIRIHELPKPATRVPA
jgi:N-acetylglucosamine-6-phosphate deacetylase